MIGAKNPGTSSESPSATAGIHSPSVLSNMVAELVPDTVFVYSMSVASLTIG